MPSAGGQEPRQTVAPASASDFGDRESEAAVVRDTRHEGALAAKVD